MSGTTILIGFLLILLGLALLRLAIRERETGFQSRNWPSVEGTILQVSASTHVDEGHLTYYSKVIYQYMVNKRIYRNDRVEIGAKSGGSQRLAQRWSERYSTGRNVAVYHHPQNPSEAVLEPNSTSGILSAVGFAALFLFSGIVILITSALNWIF
jgi:hypothetical protein